MRLLITLATILLWTSCKPAFDNKIQPTTWNIVGSWYTDLRDSGIYENMAVNYAEIYVNDTSLFYYEEIMGQSYDQSYFIKNDTIFKCSAPGKSCEFIAMFIINDFKNDTLWLTVNKEYTKSDPTTYWVKFPKDEKGHYEHEWTKETTDSLRWLVQYDYDRRKFKFYATLWDNIDAYDSALRAGEWKWDMNDRHIQEELQRRKKRAE